MALVTAAPPLGRAGDAAGMCGTVCAMKSAHPAGRLLTTLEWRRRLVFWSGAVATGAVAVVFALGSDLAIRLFRQSCTEWKWWPFVATPLGLMLCIWITRTWFAGSEGSGIPQTIAALNLPGENERDRLLSPRIAFGKILVTLLALASGASIGREGPTVQVGASIMHSLRRYARFPVVDVDRGLILAGGAAGVAAAFNTPLAGVVFAIEELSRSFEERTSGVILMAVIIAGVTSMAIVGNYTYFGSTSAVLTSVEMWAVVPLCGVAGGLFGGLFSRLMLTVRHRLPGPLRQIAVTRPVLFAAICGLLLAVIGWIGDGTTFGTGYQEARDLLQQGHYPTPAFALLKGLATIVSYATGIPGGIFAPSLAVGAGIGGELHAWLPIAPVGTFVVLAMAAYFAGVVQAPLTALVIVVEMTNDRALMLPLMAAVLLGRGASALVCREPLYRSLARRFLPGGDPGTVPAASRLAEP
jgi:chloride channel protein, CIC family